MHNRSFSFLPWLLAVVISVGVGIAAYNAGLSHGLATTVSTAAAAAPPNTVVTVPAWGLGWHYWHPFGFVFPLFFLFFWVFVAKAFFWRARWHHYGPPPAFSDRFDQWHREAHERMNRPAEPTRL